MKKKLTWSALAKFISRESSEREEEAVNQWMEEKESHRQLYNDSRKVTQDHKLEYPQFDVERGKKLLRSKMSTRRSIPVREESPKMVWLKWAAVVMLLVSVTAFFLAKDIFPFDTRTEIVTMPGEKYTLRLPDGTFIMLNSGSRLTYDNDFGKVDRNVTLTGEAYFDVHSDREKPFTIHAGEVNVRVLGTAFNVNANPGFNEYTVAVSEGNVKVRIAGSDKEVNLIKNQKVAYDRSTGKLSKDKTDLLMELAWMENKLIFKDTPLSEVAVSLELVYGIPVRFENEKITNCVITGKFERTTLRKIIMSICYSNELKYEYKDNYVMLKGKGC